jgi:predicted Fe-Mo cluster-binding NifX family protein
MEFEALENQNAMAAGGAGISTAQMVAQNGVGVVLTGNSGPNAYQVLSSAGIQVINGVTGRIRDAIQGYKMGQFQSASQPSVAAHFGMGMGTGPGMGMGGGMGRGMGRGMGMGRSMGTGGGMGMGMGMMPPAPPQPQSPEQEMEVLKNQAQLLSQQLEELQRRIKELGDKKR